MYEETDGSADSLMFLWLIYYITIIICLQILHKIFTLPKYKNWVINFSPVFVYSVSMDQLFKIVTIILVTLYKEKTYAEVSCL
jgi:hypothetical protein